MDTYASLAYLPSQGAFDAAWPPARPAARCWVSALGITALTDLI